jgi:hypothetical protein
MRPDYPDAKGRQGYYKKRVSLVNINEKILQKVLD